MNAKLTFNKVSFNAVNNPNDTTQIWITSADLAKALGYARADSVSRIYDRNSDEFTEQMSQTVNLTVSGEIKGLQYKSVRIFSLPGCHLIAMFAKTPVAKEFRRWVLDIIEKSGEQSIIERRLSTTAERVPLKDAVYNLMLKRQLSYPMAYKAVNKHFGVKSAKQLMADQVPLAIAYANKLALDGELLEDDFQHPLFGETRPVQVAGIQNMVNSAVACITVWDDVYPWLIQANPKAAASMYSFFEELTATTCDVAKTLNLDLCQSPPRPWALFWDNWQGMYVSQFTINQINLALNHTQWTWAWFKHYQPALEMMNRKVTSSISDHFTSAVANTRSIAGALNFDLLDRDRLACSLRNRDF